MLQIVPTVVRLVWVLFCTSKSLGCPVRYDARIANPVKHWWIAASAGCHFTLTQKDAKLVNTLGLGYVCIRQWIGASLVPIMTYRPFGHQGICPNQCRPMVSFWNRLEISRVIWLKMGIYFMHECWIYYMLYIIFLNDLYLTLRHISIHMYMWYMWYDWK